MQVRVDKNIVIWSLLLSSHPSSFILQWSIEPRSTPKWISPSAINRSARFSFFPFSGYPPSSVNVVLGGLGLRGGAVSFFFWISPFVTGIKFSRHIVACCMLHVAYLWQRRRHKRRNERTMVFGVQREGAKDNRTVPVMHPKICYSFFILYFLLGQKFSPFLFSYPRRAHYGSEPCSSHCDCLKRSKFGPKSAPLSHLTRQKHKQAQSVF